MTAMQKLEARFVEKGINVGIERGIEKGRQSTMLEMAKNMLHQLHLSIDLVQKATGMNRKDLERLSSH